MKKIVAVLLETVIRIAYGKQVLTQTQEAVTLAEHSPLKGKFKKEFVIETLGDTAKRLTELGVNALVELAALWITAKLGKSVFKK